MVTDFILNFENPRHCALWWDALNKTASPMIIPAKVHDRNIIKGSIGEDLIWVLLWDASLICSRLKETKRTRQKRAMYDFVLESKQSKDTIGTNSTIWTRTVNLCNSVTVVVQLLSCIRLFCDPMGCSPPGSSVRGISQVRILEWVDISSFRGSFWSRGETWVALAGRFFTTEPPGNLMVS